MNEGYAFDYLGRQVTVHIDRPMGSKHPKHDFHYPVNYGYLPGTIAPDGEEIDAYVMGVYIPVESFTGICIAIIQRDDDEDDKLVVVPEGRYYSDDQIRAFTEFQERFFNSKIVR